MRCDRCNGLMVVQRYGDLLDDSGRLFFDAWRCITCGDVVDPVIRVNRKNRPNPSVHGNRKLKMVGKG